MEILNRLIGELKEALQYFKQRTKYKYYGDRFEEWVVMHSNISKDGMPGTGYFSFLEIVGMARR